LVEDAVSGAEVARRLPALVITHLPLCLQRGEGPVCSRLALLWYLLSPLFCEQARLCLRAFHRKVLSLFFFPPPPSLSLWLSHSLGCYLTFSSVQFSSVAQSCPTLCDPMNRSTPGLPVHHQLPEFIQTRSIKSVMPSSHLILCRPLLLLPPIPPSIRVFSNESTLRISSLRFSSDHSGLVISLSNEARTSLFSPGLLLADTCIWVTFPLGVEVRRVICGFVFCFFFPLLVMLPSEIPKLPTDTPVRGFPGVWKLLLHNSLMKGSPFLSLLSLFLSFIFCPTSFQREWAAFLGVWCPPPAFRSCFVEFVQRSNDLSMNL